MAYTEATLTTNAWAADDPGNPNDTYSIVAGKIAALRAKIVANNSKIIYFSDIDEIRSLVSYVKYHTHTYTDYDAIADYGNNGVRTIGPTLRGSQYGRKSVGLFKGVDEFEADLDTTAPPGFAQNSAISATHHNKFVTNYNIMVGHYHQFDDDTYYFEDPPPPDPGVG